MTFQAEFTTVLSEEPAILEAIGDHSHSLAVWRRAHFPDIDTLLAFEAANIRIRCEATGAADSFRKALLAKGYRPGPALDALIADVADLAVRFASASGTERIKIRIERVSTNSCRKFHADYTTMRLITTYRGPGTQWIDGADIGRVAAGEEPMNIHALATGHVGIFKGRLLADEPAILHRSPPIADLDIERSLLVIDPADKAQ